MSHVHGKNTTVYNVVNKEKYVGDKNPVCRSSWEESFCRWLDMTPRIVQWASEPLAIPYKDEARRDENGNFVERRYYPDFLVKVIDKSGKSRLYVVEIKPHKYTKLPKKGKKSNRTLVKEHVDYITNSSKFKAADLFCKQRNMEFKVVTEKDMFKAK